jgi:biotin---protein ligase
MFARRLIPIPFMDILVYAGEGSDPLSVHFTLSSLRQYLGHRYAVKKVTSAAVLREEPWTYSTVLLVLPGGRDRSYVEHLDCRGSSGHTSASFSYSANERIRAYVESGGRYLGICAGAYYACDRIEFEMDRPEMCVEGARTLGLFPGVGRGSVFPGFAYGPGSRDRCVQLQATFTRDVIGQENFLFSSYFNGGCEFITSAELGDHRTVNTLAIYTHDAKTAGRHAVVEIILGQGKAILSGVHIEIDPFEKTWEYSKEILAHAPTTFRETLSALIRSQTERVLFWKRLLERFGLHLNDTLSIGGKMEGNLDSLVSMNSQTLYLSNPNDPEQLLTKMAHSGAGTLPLRMTDSLISSLSPSSSTLASSPASMSTKMDLWTLVPFDFPRDDRGQNKAAVKPVQSPPALSFSIDRYQSLLSQSCMIGKTVIYGETVSSTQSLLEM